MNKSRRKVICLFHFKDKEYAQDLASIFLIQLVNDATISAKTKLEQIKARRSAVSIADMFDMQMLMNHLSQLSEMSTAVVNASNTAIGSMARNVKG